MRTLFVALVGAFAGIAFVIACGDHSDLVDAGADARAAACSVCEKPITAARYYRVRSRTTARTPGKVYAQARCTVDEDILISGGCTLFLSSASTTPFDGGLEHVALIDSGLIAAAPKGEVPDDDARWLCYYDNPDDQPDLQVVATAICFHPEPQ